MSKKSKKGAKGRKRTKRAKSKKRTKSTSNTIMLPTPPLLPHILELNATMFHGIKSLPGELRELIFSFVLGTPWDGTTPALIAALRPEKEMYGQCIFVFRRHLHTYVLHRKNDWSWLDMPKEVIATIIKIRIVVDETHQLHPLLDWATLPTPSRRVAQHSMQTLAYTASLAPSITHVTLTPRPLTKNLYFWYPIKFPIYFVGFANLVYAATTCPVKPNAPVWEGGVGIGVREEDGWVDVMWQRRTMCDSLVTADEQFGVKAKLGRVWEESAVEVISMYRRERERDEWVWCKGNGEKLKRVALPAGLSI